jgi:Zn-dependent protease/predicted transcriptional regulator
MARDDNSKQPEGPASAGTPTGGDDTNLRPAEPAGFRVGSVFGVPIYLHPTWLIIFLMITYSLATQFTFQHKNWSTQQHWSLGVITSILFFASVVFHELSHSLVAKLYRIPVESITLFIFGGVSRIGREAATATQEFLIAIAGPLSSLVLAGCFWLVTRFFHSNELVVASCTWLWEINVALAVFNLIPGFPLDGGRMLRGLAWAITKDFDRATKIASNVGRFFAYIMILIGVWQAFTGNWVGGLWIAFIGWFLLSAARESYSMVTIRHTLSGVRAQDIMSPDVPTVERNISIEDYVNEVMRTGRRFHIVTGAGRPVGLVTLHAGKSVARDEWSNTSIQAVMMPIDRIHWATPDESALAVLARMQEADINQMPVISGENIVGVIGRETILRALQTRLQLEHSAS